MPDSPLKGPVPDDLLAVAGHACSARFTRLPDIEEGIDFTPDATVAAEFAHLQGTATPRDEAAPDGAHRKMQLRADTCKGERNPDVPGQEKGEQNPECS